MFEVGFTEMVLIAVVALLVLGPERLPKAARFAGLWVRKARAQWFSVKAEFEREMAVDELRRSVDLPTQVADDVRAAVGDPLRDAEALLSPPAPGARPATDPRPGPDEHER